MPLRLKEFLQRWLINTLAVLATTHILSGIAYDNWQGLLIATFLLGILNTLLRPIKIFFGLVTLGILTWIINALLLLLVGKLVPAFHVDTFWYALWGALIISIISITLTGLTGTGRTRVEFKRRRSSSDQDRNDGGGSGGGGPVIDV